MLTIVLFVVAMVAANLFLAHLNRHTPEPPALRRLREERESARMIQEYVASMSTPCTRGCDPGYCICGEYGKVTHTYGPRGELKS